MIVTEEEAKTKRCQESFPAADALSPEGSSHPGAVVMHQSTTGPMGYAASTMSYAQHTAPTHCIGSACMAWRWQDNLSPVQQRGAYGYCGKAGRP